MPADSTTAAARLTIPDFALVLLSGGTPAERDAFLALHFPGERPFDGPSIDLDAALAARAFVILRDAAQTKNDRAAILALAKRRHAPRILLLLPPADPPQIEDFRQEGFATIEIPVGPVTLDRVPLPCDRRMERGPFDLIGDIHGCRRELEALLDLLGYRPTPVWAHPDGRRVVFLGDFVDRGPESPGALRLVLDMLDAGTALAVPGNHDVKAARRLAGRGEGGLSHGLAATFDQFGALSAGDRAALIARFDAFATPAPRHLWLDGGRLVAVHAGLRADMIGRSGKSVDAFALYGDTTGELDGFGLPERRDWAVEYRGDAVVVHGHTPMREPRRLGKVQCLDTGCVFGGRLTALRWPEDALVAVTAEQVYAQPTRPMA